MRIAVGVLILILLSTGVGVAQGYNVVRGLECGEVSWYPNNSNVPIGTLLKCENSIVRVDIYGNNPPTVDVYWFGE